ncbi:MAG: hypothetical protein NVS3B10_16320 [Polyangiales bacterium]
MSGRRSTGALAAMALVAGASGASCHGDRVSPEVGPLADVCALSAGVYMELRAAAGDYDREEGRRRAKDAEDDLKRSCAPPATKVDCCAASKRLKRALAGGHVANCVDFFTRVAQDGCAPQGP